MRFWGEVQVLLNSLYTNVVTVIIAVGGSQLIRGGRMEQTGINTASTYMGKVNQYQAELLTQYQRVKGTQGALRRANGLLSLEEENREAGDGEMVCKDLVFDHVSFSFDGSRPILRDATFTIPQGKQTALIGKNGSGKSTVFLCKKSRSNSSQKILKMRSKAAFLQCSSVLLRYIACLTGNPV